MWAAWRHWQLSDLFELARCNLDNLPENYLMVLWQGTIVQWPELSFLAEDDTGKVVGYVLSSIGPEDCKPYAVVGCINSLSVLRPYRRLGIAQKLMNLSKEAILREYESIDAIQLQVRKSNKVAQLLYNKLGYKYLRTAKNYYPEEDALIMQLQLRPSRNAENPSHTRRQWLAGLLRLIHSRPQKIAEATMSLLRRNSVP